MIEFNFPLSKIKRLPALQYWRIRLGFQAETAILADAYIVIKTSSK